MSTVLARICADQVEPAEVHILTSTDEVCPPEKVYTEGILSERTFWLFFLFALLITVCLYLVVVPCLSWFRRLNAPVWSQNMTVILLVFIFAFALFTYVSYISINQTLVRSLFVLQGFLLILWAFFFFRVQNAPAALITGIIYASLLLVQLYWVSKETSCYTGGILPLLLWSLLMLYLNHNVWVENKC